MTPAAGDNTITAVILTFDEAIHIGRCIERAFLVADRVVVVDSLSSDGTPDIARSLGADVVQRPFTFHADQFEWGAREAGVVGGWILRLDADEYLEQALIAEIRERLPRLTPDQTAVEMPLKVKFQGRWIRWGGYSGTVLTRLWRAGAARFEMRLMDERVVVQRGTIVRFADGALIDDNLKDIAFWTDKHNGYSTRHMVQFIDLEYGFGATPNDPPSGLNAQGRKKRFLRENVYASAPLYLRAVLYYLYRYILRLGFLDGREGFVWHTLQGFWHMLLIDVKIGEARRFIAAHGIDEFRAHLRHRYGIGLAESQPAVGDLADGANAAQLA